MTLSELGALYASKVAEVERENASLRAEVKKLQTQLDGASDDLYEAGLKIRELNELNEELRQLNSKATRRAG